VSNQSGQAAGQAEADRDYDRGHARTPAASGLGGSG
jgi:hypothetical protein